MILSAGLTAFLDFIPLSLAIAAAAWLLMRLTPPMSAATRHAIWWLVLAFVVLLPAGFAIHDAAGALAQSRPARTAAAPAIRPSPADADLKFVAPPAVPLDRHASPARPAPFEIPSGRWADGLVTLWGLIFSVLLARLALGYLRLRGMKRRAWAAPPELQHRLGQWINAWEIRRDVRLLVSDEISTPLAAGFFHPAVVLPSRLMKEFGPTELDHVLMHELTHVARLDDWANLLCRVAYAALWFHPAAVLALRRIEREREMACDERVVSATGAARPYAVSLARLFEFCAARRRDPLAAGMAGHGSHLGERIEVLMRRKHPSRGGVSILLLAAIGLALLVVVAICARTPRWVVMTPARWNAVPKHVRPVLAAAPAPPAARFRVNKRSKVTSEALADASETPAAALSPAAAPADPHSFLAAVVAAGYGDLSVDEIIQLSNSGVSGQYLMASAKAGWGKLAPRDVINLHNSGVSIEFLRAVADARIPGLSVQGVIDLSNNGVGASYISAMQAAGAGDYTKEQIIQLHNNGVKPSLVAALRDAGFKKLDVRDVIEANNYGLRPSDLNEALKYGSNLTLKQVIKLKQAGVL